MLGAQIADRAVREDCGHWGDEANGMPEESDSHRHQLVLLASADSFPAPSSVLTRPAAHFSRDLGVLNTAVSIHGIVKWILGIILLTSATTGIT